MAEEGSARDEDYVKVIKHGDQAIYMIGTAHISEQSCADIRELIEEIQPSIVMVELCDARLQRLVNNVSGVRNSCLFIISILTAITGIKFIIPRHNEAISKRKYEFLWGGVFLLHG